MLVNYLKKLGKDVVHLREPGGTAVGEQVREILLDVRNRNLSKLGELFLYLTARRQLILEYISPALREGKIVVCDRFIDSTIAYQGAGRGLSLDLIKRLNKLTCGDLMPDLTFILDIEAELGIRNALKKYGDYKAEGDRMEQEEIDFYKRVREGYLRLAQDDPDRVKVIRFELGPEKIHKAIVDELKKRKVIRKTNAL
jgi:dTMP kinase